MKIITVRNLTIQFDADTNTNGDPLEQTLQAIELINQTLLAGPFEMQPQIMGAHEITADHCEIEGIDEVTWTVYCLKSTTVIRDGFDTEEEADEWLDKQLRFKNLEHEKREDYDIYEEDG